MKAKMVVLFVIDFDNVGDDIKPIIENQKFPNHCIHPKVMDVRTVDIGDWSDDHPLNCDKTFAKEYKRLFDLF